MGLLQRLVAHSEEVAFNDPPGGASEQMILNQHLHRLTRHARLSAFQRFVQQVRLSRCHASMFSQENSCIMDVHGPAHCHDYQHHNL